MKHTGIVRRIDDLGRIVIPKELRRTLHVRDGDPFEIGVDNGMFYLRPYCPATEVATQVEALMDSLREEIMASTGDEKECYDNAFKLLREARDTLKNKKKVQ